MPKLPILCYHKVGPIAEEGRRLNIEPERLEQHVRHFKRRGFRFVLPGELHANWPERGVCFTFDDAYTSTLEHAPPIFQKHDVRCAFYVVTGKVGMTSDWDGEMASPLATWQALLQAHINGFEIGNHSTTHSRLAKLPLEDQAREIKTALDELRSQGVRCLSVCYPYGSWNHATLNAAAGNGYSIGLALGKRPAREHHDPLLALPRIVVSYSDALPKLLYKIHLRHRLP